jgi:hypothetical protein
MSKRLAGRLIGALVAGLALVPAYAAQPAPQAADPQPRPMDISQIPPLGSAPTVFEPAGASAWPRVPPSAADLAYHAMLLGTAGMEPGEVAGGPKVRLAPGEGGPSAPAPWPRPKLVLPSLQPGAVLVPTEGGEPWKKSLPPLPHLAGK